MTKALTIFGAGSTKCFVTSLSRWRQGRHHAIQLFREKLSKKMCTRQSRKVIWDMINTLFLTTVAVEPTLLLSFSTRKHISMAFRANSFKFLCKNGNSKPPTMPFRICACTFPDNLSRNSCICKYRWTSRLCRSLTPREGQALSARRGYKPHEARRLWRLTSFAIHIWLIISVSASCSISLGLQYSIWLYKY